MFAKKNLDHSGSALENHLKFKTRNRYRAFSLLKPSEMAFLTNSRWQNRKERSNRPTSNGDTVEKPKRNVVYEWVCDIPLIIEKLSF